MSCAELDRGEKDPAIKPKDLNKVRIFIFPFVPF